MTKEEKSEIKYRMKRLAIKFCRRNDVYTDFDGVVGELVERAYLSACLLCLHENKNKIAELEKEKCELLGIIQGKDKAIQELQQQIEQLQKINNEQKETLKEVRVALIKERAANIMNYGKGGAEMFDSLFELLKGVSN